MTTTSPLELFFAALVAAIGGIHATWKAKRAETIGIADVALWFTAIFFGIGPWVAVLAGGTLPDNAPSVIVGSYVSIAIYLAGLAAGGTLVGLFVKRRQPWESGEERRGLAPIMAIVEYVNMPLLMALYAVAIGVKVYVGYKYRIFFSGDLESKLIPMPYVLRSIWDLTPLIFEATFLWASVMLCARGRHRRIAAVTVIVGLLLSFTVGRRWLIGDMFLLSLCYYFYRGISLRVFVVSMFLLAVLFFVAMPFFWRVRYYRQLESVNDNAIGSVVTAAVRAATDWDNEQLRAAYNMNLSSRPVFIGFNMAIFEGQQSRPIMGGRALMSCLIGAVPSAVYPDKILMTDPEQQIEEAYGMGYYDASSNWPAYGLADFGMLGAFLVGVFVASVLAAAEVVAVWLGWRMPLMAILTAGSLFQVASAVEESPVHLLSTVRNLVFIIVPLLFVIPFLRRPALRHAAAAGDDPHAPSTGPAAAGAEYGGYGNALGGDPVTR